MTSSSSSPSSSSSSTQQAKTQSHYFPTPALDHAFSGIMAGAVATVCMNPLDLIKVQFQVNTSSSKKSSGANVGGVSSFRPVSAGSLARKITGVDVLRDMYDALQVIVKRDGYAGLYRGLTPNVVGNSASWGLYFLFYTMLKESMAKRQDQHANDGGTGKQLSAGQHLLAASESGAITALMTNPIWVVKTRMFTTSKSGMPLYPATQAPTETIHGSTVTPTTSSSSLAPTTKATLSGAAAPTTYIKPSASQEPVLGLIQGVRLIWKREGIRGLYRGGGLALFGVSNGAVQFMTYEELKRWRMGVARKKQIAQHGISSAAAEGEAIKLDNAEYIIMSGVSKVAAICLTYPYQVIRSRIQNHTTAHIYPNIPTCIRLTFRHEGFRGFYKGMAANLVRILPGTCVTFVVYENCSWALRGLAERRRAADADQGEIRTTV